MNRTLLYETEVVMNRVGKRVEDIDWIGSEKFGYMNWEEFSNLANVEYNSGYGSAEIAQDLVIVFKDSTWFSRGEYDGSEWWDYNRTPKKPEEHKVPLSVKYVDRLGDTYSNK